MREKAELSPEDKLSCLRYLNSNKHFFIGEPCTEEEQTQLAAIMHMIEADDFFQALINNPDSYFEHIKKSWDIEYQIHELGFERIGQLFAIIKKLSTDYSQYDVILKELLSSRKDAKDNFLIQLFNRYYLNNHPNPPLTHLTRYVHPRYIEGKLYRDEGNEHHFEKQWAHLLEKLETCDNEQDLEVLRQLNNYYEQFHDQFFSVTEVS